MEIGSFYTCNQINEVIRVGSSPMTYVLIGRGKFGHRYEQREDGHVMMKAEILVIHPQNKESQGLQGVTRG